MSPEDRAAVLAQIGVKPEDAPAPQTPEIVAASDESVPAPQASKRKKATKKEVVATEGDSASDVLARILKNAGADQAAAFSMCDAQAQAFFDARKVSKIEAARRDLDSKAHNKALWEQTQTLRSTLKTGVRKHFRDGTIATKIVVTSKKAEVTRDAGDDAILASLVATDAFRALFAEHKKSLKSQEG